jgi:hypothetical protein
MSATFAIRGEFHRLRYALTELELEQRLKRLSRIIGYELPKSHRWLRARCGALKIPSLVSLKWNVAALCFQLALLEAAYRECKAGFDPNQPRVPQGQPGGGQWTDAGGGTGDSKPSGAAQGAHGPLKITIHPPSWYQGTSDPSGPTADTPPAGDVPTVPEQEPESSQALNQFAKEAAYWLAKAARREVVSPEVGTFINVLEAAHWAYKVYPYIQAYLDPPKTLDELQRAVATPKKGYDVHHVVEQTGAEKDKYPRQMIDASENLVRIPTLKHWQITGWYMTPNERFGGLTPRQYLRGKRWEARRAIGYRALVRFKVLKR